MIDDDSTHDSVRTFITHEPNQTRPVPVEDLVSRGRQRKRRQRLGKIVTGSAVIFGLAALVLSALGSKDPRELETAGGDPTETSGVPETPVTTSSTVQEDDQADSDWILLEPGVLIRDTGNLILYQPGGAIFNLIEDADFGGIVEFDGDCVYLTRELAAGSIRYALAINSLGFKSLDLENQQLVYEGSVPDENGDTIKTFRNGDTVIFNGRETRPVPAGMLENCDHSGEMFFLGSMRRLPPSPPD